MVLQKGAIEVPFGGGMDESVQKELLDAGSAVHVLENLRVEKRGAYTKRNGFEGMSRTIVGGGLVTSGFSVHEYDERGPVLTDGEWLYDWSANADDAGVPGAWVRRGRVPEVVVTRETGVQPPARSYSLGYESVIFGKFRLIAYTTPLGANSGDPSYDPDETGFSDLYATVQDAETGAVLFGPVRLTRIFGDGSFTVATTDLGYAVVTGLDTVGWPVTAINIKAWTFSAQAPASAPTVTTWVTSPTWVGWFGCVVSRAPRPFSSALHQLIYLHGTATAGVFQWRLFDPATGMSVTGTTSAPGTLIAGFGRSMCLHYDAELEEKVWLAWAENVSGTWRWRAQLFTPFFVALSTKTNLGVIAATGPHTISCTLGELTTGNAPDLWVCKSENILGFNTPSQSAIVPCWVTPTRTAPGVWTLARNDGYFHGGLSAYSDPINRNGRWYQWVKPCPYEMPEDLATGQFPPYLVLAEVRTDARTLRPVANVAPGLLSPQCVPLHPHYSQPTGDGYEVPMLVRRNSTTHHVEVAKVAFGDSRRMHGAQFGDLLALSGGYPVHFDGETLSEVGFAYPPTISVRDVAYNPTNDRNAAQDGTYAMFCIWERTDARGNVHRSEMSNIVTMTLSGGTDRVFIVSAYPLMVTYAAGLSSPTADAASNVRLVVYCTRANESTFYRAADAAATTTPSPVTIRFADDMNELFYSQPGVPGAAALRYAPPSLRGMIMHNGSLVGVADDGRTLWFSGAHVPGEGPWFNPSFVAYVDDPSTVVALASLDGRLFAFTRRSIWVLDGQGFADNGEGGYSLPYRVPSEGGCTNERSVCVTPVGVLFESDAGICLLSRAGEVTPFGRVVEDTLAEYPRITSAVLCPDTGEVRFSCVHDAESEEAATRWCLLVWNWRDNVWSLSTADVGSDDALVHAASIVDDGTPRWHGLLGNGKVLLDGQQFGDYHATLERTATRSRLETAWIKVSGVQGLQRVWRILLLFNRRGPTGLTIRLRYDYDDETDVEVRTWTQSDLAALPKGQVEIHCKRQQCMAVKVVVEDAPTEPGNDDTAGNDYLGLRLIVGTKGKTPLGAKYRGRAG